MMAAVILLAFVLLGGAFAALSYQYIVRDRQASMQRNANYIATFTTSYLSDNLGAGVQDRGSQRSISSLANISDSTVRLAQEDVGLGDARLRADVGL